MTNRLAKDALGALTASSLLAWIALFGAGTRIGSTPSPRSPLPALLLYAPLCTALLRLRAAFIGEFTSRLMYRDVDPADAAAGASDAATWGPSDFARSTAALSLLAFVIGYDLRKFEGVLSLIPGFGLRGEAA